MEIIKRLLGENIKVERMLLGLTQKELADKINITPTRLCNWEKGTRTPTLEHLMAIASALEICISTLLIGVDNTNKSN